MGCTYIRCYHVVIDTYSITGFYRSSQFPLFFAQKSWDTKVAERLQKKLEKEFERNLKEEKKKMMEILKKREKEKREKKRENEKKGEVVIPIKDTSKIKRMKKKQLKYIQKR